MKKNSYFAFFEKSFSLIILTLLLFVVVSCAPMTTKFYRPAAIDGKVVFAHCPPVESFILFETGGIILGSKASKSTDDLITVMITFEVPDGKKVKLMDHEIYSLIDNQVFARSNLLGAVRVSAGRTSEFIATTPMLGKTEKKLFFKQITLYGTTEHAYYFFSGQLSVPNLESFIIKLPNFSVNGVLVKPPIIRFSQDSMQYIRYQNC